MSNRKAALSHIRKVLDEKGPDYLRYGYVPRRFMDKVEHFNDDTVEMLSAALRNESVRDDVAMRAILLIDSGQQRNLEVTVRNIAIFAETEAPYKKSLDMRSETWKKLNPVERFVRKHVCGGFNALETPEQVPQMIAAMHAAFAITAFFMKINKIDAYLLLGTIRGLMTRLEKGELDQPSYRAVWETFNDLNGAYEMVDFFIAHPEQAERLAEFVSERGIVEIKVLEDYLSTTGSIAIGIL